MDDVPTRLDDFVFHSVLIGLKAEDDLTTENFLNAFRIVRLKLSLPDGIKRNSDDKRITRNHPHARNISLRVHGNRQDNCSTDVQHIRATWRVNRLCLFDQSLYL
jgi:hypothetical protein